MKPRHKRLAIAGRRASPRWASIVALVLNAFQSNLVFFYSPTPGRGQRGAHRAAPSASAGWSRRAGQASTARQVQFVVTDTAKTMPVRYQGILPDLFKEGKGVVAQGQLRGRRVRRPRGAGQARRELHAARGRRGAEAGAARLTRKLADSLVKGARQMIPELGHFAALAGAGRGAGAGRRAAGRRAARPRRLDGAGAAGRAACCSCWWRCRFACLTIAFVQHDFSVLLRGIQLQQRAAAGTTASPRSGAATKARCCCGC